MSTNIDQLSIEITASSQTAASAIENLKQSLNELSGVLKTTGKDYYKLGTGLRNAVAGANAVNGNTTANMSKLAKAFKEFEGIDTSKFSGRFSKNLQELVSTANAADPSTYQNITNLAKAIGTFTGMKMPNISANFVNNIRQLDETAQKLNPLTVTRLTQLSGGLKSIADIGKIGVSKGLGSALLDVAVAIKEYTDQDIQRLGQLGTAMQSFPKGMNIGKDFGARLLEVVNASRQITDDAIMKMQRFADACKGLQGIDFRGVSAAMRQTGKQNTGGGSGSTNLPGSPRQPSGTVSPKDSVEDASEQAKRGFSAGFFETVNSELSKTSGKFSEISKIISSCASGTISWQMALGKVAATIAISIIKDFLNTLKKTVEFLGQLGSAMSDAFGKAGSAVMQVISKIGSAVAGLASKALSAFASIGKSFLEISGKSIAFVAEKAFDASPIVKFANAVKSAVKTLGTLASSLARIGMYRVLRTLFKDISSGLEDAIQQLYKFDQGLGGSFAKNMDSITQSTQNLKASFGTLAANVINLLTPAINAVLSIITTLTDALSQLFAILGGNVFYKAADSTAKYGDTISSNSKATKEWKNQLMGFDEINKLTDNSSSGSGSGSNSSIPINYQLMKELPDWLKEIQALIASDKWREAGFALADHLYEVVSKFDADKFATELGTKIEHAIEFALGFLSNTRLFTEAGKKLAQAVNGLVHSISGATLGQMMAAKLNAIAAAIGSFVNYFDVSEFSKQMGDVMVEFVNGINFARARTYFQVGLHKIFEGAKVFMSTFSLGDAVDKLATAISEGLSTAASEIDSTDIIEAVVGWVTDVKWEENAKKLGASAGTLTQSFVSGLKKSEMKKAAVEAFRSVLGFITEFVAHFDIADAVNTMSDTVVFALEEFKRTIEEEDIATKILGWVGDIDWEGNATKLGTGVGELAQAFIDNLKTSEMKKAASRAFRTVLNFITSLIEHFSIGDAVNKAATTIGEEMNDIGSQIQETDIINKIIGWVDDIDWVGNAQKLGTGAAQLSNSILHSVNWTSLGNSLGNKFRAALTLASSFLTNFDFAGAVSGMSTALATAIEDMAETISEADLAGDLETAVGGVDVGGAVGGISRAAIKLVNALTNQLKKINESEEIKAKISEAFDAIDWGAVFDSVIDLALEAWKLKWQLRWEAFKAFTKGLLSGGEYSSVLDDTQEELLALLEMPEMAYQYGKDTLDRMTEYVEKSAGLQGEDLAKLQAEYADVIPTLESIIEQYNGQKEAIETATSTMESSADVVSGLSDTYDTAAEKVEAVKEATEAVSTENLDEVASTADEINTVLPETAQLIQETIVNSVNEAKENFDTAVTGMYDSIVSFRDNTAKCLDDIKLSLLNTRMTFESESAKIINSITSMKTAWATDWGKPTIAVPKFQFVGTTMFTSSSGYSASIEYQYLAKGGIVDGATPFVAGEDGKEAVIPLERNTEWIGAVAKQLSEYGNDDEGNNEVINAVYTVGELIVNAVNGKDMNTYLDGKKISEAVTSYQRRTARALGA